MSNYEGLSLVVAIIAFVISLIVYLEQKKLNTLAYRPHLSVFLFNSTDTGGIDLYIQNNGLGVGIVEDIIFHTKDESFSVAALGPRVYAEMFVSLGINQAIFTRYITSRYLLEGSHIRPGSDSILLSFPGDANYLHLPFGAKTANNKIREGFLSINSIEMACASLYGKRYITRMYLKPRKISLDNGFVFTLIEADNRP